MEKDIIRILENSDKALDFLEISEKLGFGKEMDEILANKLTEMVNKYQLYLSNKGRYTIFHGNEKKEQLYRGKFLDTNSDYSFVRVDGVDDDIFIHGSKKNGALNGDIVLIRLTKNAKDGRKAEGEVIKVIEREMNNRVGEIYHYQNKMMVSLDDKKIKKLVTLYETPETRRLVDGDKVVVSFEGAKLDKKDNVQVKLVKRLGHVNDPGVDILSIIAEHEIETEFPEEVIEELKNIPTEVSSKDLEGRRDLRDKLIYTIDGDDTKDIDDAISVERLDNGNYKLGVHIADVSYYIKENSALDLEARRRGTSTYLVDRVIPMYPHQLSNGICSLNPMVDRLTISCEMEINPNGKLVNYEIFPSVIHSNIQMTYNKVNQILEENTIPEGYEKYANNLKLAQELAHIIRKDRTKRGAIDFDTDEAKILVDENCSPKEIALRYRGEGEKLIEDFMVRANETVASHFFYMDLPSLYRIHGMPDEDRLQKFLAILSGLGISLKMDVKKMNAKVIQKIVEELREYPEFRILCQKLLSCMDKAIYSPENIGHFALASKIYTHFTSPIRRYPDTTIHRLLHTYFFSKDGITEEKIEHFKEILGEIAMHSSTMERNSDECERDVEEMKMAEYMENHIGEEFSGMISGITNYGFFVQLDNMIEGLVKADLFNGLYQYDNDIEMAKVENEVFKLGQRVTVKVLRASKDDSEIDFVYVGGVNECEKVKKKC